MTQSGRGTPSPALSFLEEGLAALGRSVHDHNGELRNVQLATMSPEGWPNVRTLVLRGFGRSPACAELHSDARAPKVRDIDHCGRVTLLAWSAAEHLQLRFTGTAMLHRADDVASARWEGLSPAARKPYGLRAVSGAPIEDPAVQPHLPAELRSAQFVVIMVSLVTVDILRLGADGEQTRASGCFTASGLTAGWIGA